MSDTELKLKEELRKTKQTILELESNKFDGYLDNKFVDFFKEALENPQLGFLNWNLQTNEILLSEGARTIFEIPDQETLITSELVERVVHPKDKAFVSESLEKAIGGDLRYDIDHRILLPSGKVKWLNAKATLLKDAKGDLVSLIGSIVDISHSKSSLGSDQIAHAISEGIALVALDGEILFTYPKFESMFGYEQGELVGKSISIINAPSDLSEQEVMSFILDTIKKEGTWRGEIQNIRKDGSKIWCKASVSITDHADFGEILIGIHTDIDEVKALQEELRRAVDIQEVLNRELHHRVKNNLQISSSLLTLQAIKSPNQEIKDEFNKASDRINSMSLVHEILSDKIGSTVVDPQLYFQKLWEGLGDKNGKDITLDTVSTIDKIETSILIYIGLIVNELFTNSIKYSCPDGQAGLIRLSLSQEGDQLSLIYLDTGTSDKTYNKKKTRKGLGLTLIDNLVNYQLNGTMKIVVKENFKFIMEIPMSIDVK